MRDFSLPGGFDLAITMLNSLCHLMSLDDMLRHLASVGRHLDRDGLYIMELAHPADFFAAERRTSSEWSTEVGGGTVSVRWGAQDQIDPVTQITREHVSVTYHKRGGPVRTVTDVVPNRFWTATELTAAVRLAGGFTVVARYGDFDADLPVDAADAWRMILVLRRSERARAPASSGPPPTGDERLYRERLASGGLIPVRHAVPEVAVQDGLHHLGERAALIGRRPVRGRAQRVVDLDRQVRPQAGRAGHPPLRERRRRLAVHHVLAERSCGHGARPEPGGGPGPAPPAG